MSTTVTHRDGSTIETLDAGATSTTTVIHADGTTIKMVTVEDQEGATSTTTIVHADGTTGSASTRVSY